MLGVVCAGVGGHAGCSGIRLSAVCGRGILIPVTRLQHLAALGVDGIRIGVIARGELHLVAGNPRDLAEVLREEMSASAASMLAASSAAVCACSMLIFAV